MPGTQRKPAPSYMGYLTSLAALSGQFDPKNLMDELSAEDLKLLKQKGKTFRGID